LLDPVLSLLSSSRLELLDEDEDDDDDDDDEEEELSLSLALASRLSFSAWRRSFFGKNLCL